MVHGGERRFIAPLLRHFGATPIDQIDQKAIDRAALAILPAGSNATRSRQVYTPASAALRRAGVTLDLHRPKLPPGRVRWIEPDEAARLLDACSPHLRPLVMFLLLTGARAGEALWLDWTCVDLARAHVVFPKTKAGRPRGVPLHPDLVAALANLPHRDGAVFRRPDGAPYKPPRAPGDVSAGSAIGTAFQGAVDRAGLADFHVHDCRHTWARWHYREHRDLIALQQIGGWKRLSMVTRYAHASSENHRAGINALPSLGAKSVQSKITERKAS
jgi:integrase